MIRTIIFDMGNVLVRFSHEQMCEQMGQLCGQTSKQVAAILFESGLQWEFERGKCNEQEFHRRFEEAVKCQVAIDDLRHAASDIFVPNDGIQETVIALKQAGYRLVLLSNTSIAHYEFIRSRWDLLEPFDAFVLSYEVRAIKPEPKIFHAALDAIQCRPEEAFYTDDIPAYVEAGRKHGLDAEVFTTSALLREHLASREIRLDG